MQILSGHSQMNMAQRKEHKALVLVRQGIHDDASIISIIEKDMVMSKAKNKTWKQLEMYLKWQAIEKFLSENDIKQNDYSKYKMAFQKQTMDNIEFDNKTQKILKLNYNGI